MIEKSVRHALCLEQYRCVFSRRVYMPDILKALDALTNDELEAVIDRAEEILQERVRKVPLAEDPAIGIWKDREDMKDSAAWVRRQRERWSKRLTREE
jgi:hypothetical protein